MTPEDAICKVMDARFRLAAARLKSIRSEIGQVRAAQTALDTRSTSTPLSTDPWQGHRFTGVAEHWQVWLGERRRSLQIELAALLASEADARSNLANALGRAEAARDAARRADHQAQIDRRRSMQANVTALSLLRGAPDRPGQ